MNSIPEDTELTKKLVDVQKTFPDTPDVSQIFGGSSVSSSRIRRLLWKYMENFKNYKMK